MNSEGTNKLSLKYQSVTSSGCRDKGINKIGICDKDSIPWPVFFKNLKIAQSMWSNFFVATQVTQGKLMVFQGHETH